MEVPKGIFLVLCLFGELFGLVLFIQGFLPSRNGLPGLATFDNVPKEPSGAELDQGALQTYIQNIVSQSSPKNQKNHKLEEMSEVSSDRGPVPPTIGRLVIVLIDALRSDFIYGPKGEQFMKFTRRQIDQGHARTFVARSQPPTVTMPRIKALTSGTIPGFLDVVFNLDSSKFHDDNFVSQLHRQGKRIYFYGDDTWMKLFPGHFKKTDGTTSFYVTDYTEVDNNVTRHLDSTLQDNSWDVLILHYLGLDHIGHLAGPNSPLVGPKLKEMDGIVKKIYNTVTSQDESNQDKLPTMLVLCGDHGMSDVGSHGGASHHEVYTPLIFLSSAVAQTKESMSEGSAHSEQIDLAPTLSLMMGLPIPQNSLGRALPHALKDLLSSRDLLRAMQVNSHQMAIVLSTNVEDVENEQSFELYQQALKLHNKWVALNKNKSYQSTSSMTEKVIAMYSKAQLAMQERVSSTLAKYDTYAMICGIIILWQVFFILLYITHQSVTTPTHGIQLGPAICGGFFSIFVTCCLLMFTMHFVVCTSPGGSSQLLCTLSWGSLWRCETLVSLFGFYGASLVLLMYKVEDKPLGYVSPFSSSSTIGLVVGSIIHALSLLSSSFDEEEHQTWYFLTTTLLVLIFFELLVILVQGQRSYSVNVLLITFLCLLMLRVQRSWNQTGIKWADLPDIGDWFLKPENKLYLSLLMASSCFIIYLVQIIEHGSSSPLMAAGLVSSYLYRWATEAVLLPIPFPSSEKGIYEAWFTYFVVLMMLIRALFYLCRSSNEPIDILQAANTNPWWSKPSSTSREFYQALVVLIVLLMRPHNSAVVAIMVAMQHCIVVHLLPWLQWEPWKMTLLFIWMGQASFYAQGNSNNAATIDIAAGYVGLDSHHLLQAATLVIISTFAGPLLWITRLVMCFSNRYSSRFHHSIQEVSFMMLLSRALPLAVYTFVVFLQRYHLFIWSVFSPKLLYEGAHTIVIAVFLIILQINFSAVQYLGLVGRGNVKNI